jgi:hypothetical protein
VKMKQARALSLVVVVATVMLVAPSRIAFARARALNVANEGCSSLDTAEVERILGIELASVIETWTDPEPLVVELYCTGSTVRVLAIDTVTDKKLSRELDLARVRSDRERTVALIASQLFLTSWAERLLARPALSSPLPSSSSSSSSAPSPPSPPPAVGEATDRLVRASMDQATPSPPTSSSQSKVRVAVTVVGQARVRSLTADDAAVIGFRGAVRPLVVVGERTRLFLDLSYERGSASRISGSVAYAFAGVAAGVGYRFWKSARAGVALDGGASAGVARVDLSGEPASRATTIGSAVDGLVGQAGLGFGPTFSFGGLVRVGAELDLGLTFPHIRGRVARDGDLNLSGLFTGIGLVVALEDTRQR